jgi:predicted O-linked N-acetylglucosamine transferase (SPINDLY family)
MFEAHRAWARRHAGGLPRRETRAPRERTEKLRVGFLSPAFTAGPTATFLRPLLSNLDRARFEAVAYNVGRDDESSRNLQPLFSRWHALWDASDDAVAGCIAADDIDVLVDLAGHTPGGRPLVLARKPAPVIATWLDYFDTTGLDAVDYLIGDPVSTPADGAQRFSEQVVRIAPARLCYEPPPYAPAVAPAPALRNGHVTFGSFNRLSKIAPPVIGLWARLLAAVPDSRLLVKNAALADGGMRETLLGQLAAHGVDRDRVRLRAHTAHARMLGEYGDVDIALDTFPYNGGLTTCEALWMGVPVVTMLGNAMISRQTAALLEAAGLPQLVARDERHFVEIATTLATDLPRLAAMRAGMRQRLAASPLLDAPRFARQFESALEAMCGW